MLDVLLNGVKLLGSSQFVPVPGAGKEALEVGVHIKAAGISTAPTSRKSLLLDNRICHMRLHRVIQQGVQSEHSAASRQLRDTFRSTSERDTERELNDDL